MNDELPDGMDARAAVTEEALERRIRYLEQIRDYTYKDVLLADTKAAFAITIVAGSMVAANLAVPNRIEGLTGAPGHLAQALSLLALLFAGASIGCSMLTVLPRSYVSHEMATDESHWVQMRPGWRHGMRRRLLDAVMVLFDNLWQQQVKGTPQSLALLIGSTEDMERAYLSLRDAMRRAILVQNLKYLWVGKAVMFGFSSFALVAMRVAVFALVYRN
jgi:hypothetical protein